MLSVNPYSKIRQITLPDTRSRPTSCKIKYLDLSARLNGQGQFIEGTINAGHPAYFHWFSFDRPKADISLYTHPEIETFADIFDKRLAQGVLPPVDTKKLFAVMGARGLLELGVGAEEISDHRTILISDVSNYPWNIGHFVIKDGRALRQGRIPAQGTQWIFSKDENGEVSARTVDLSAIPPKLEFGFYVNPVIVNGQALTLNSLIPGTGKTLLFSFRGSTSQLFIEDHDNEARIKSNQYIQSLIEQSRTRIVPELQGFLQGEGPIKRAVYGHTVFGLTDQSEIVIFKIFNHAAKDNGLYLEQVGPAMLAVSEMFDKQLAFAGVGSNGGDVRTFLGASNDYKNVAEDGQILQEKMTGNKPRLKKPIFLIIANRP